MRLQQEARDNGMLWDVGLGETVEDARREIQCRSVVLWEAGRRGKYEGSRGLELHSFVSERHRSQSSHRSIENFEIKLLSTLRCERIMH